MKDIYKKNLVFAAIVLFILLFLIIILKLTQEKPAQKTQIEQSTPVHTKIVKLDDLKPQYIFYGHIVGTNEIDLIANLDGKIKKVSKKFFNSSTVSQDEILFELDSFEYERDVIEKTFILRDLEIDLEKTKFLMSESKKQLKIAKQDFDRKKKLLGNTVSKKAYDDSLIKLSKAKTNFSNEEFKINSINANITKAKAQLDVSKKNLKNTKYRAPFPGKIANNIIDVGSEVMRGMLLAKMVNTEILEVKFFVGETAFTELGNIKDIKGKEIKVLWNKSKYRKIYYAYITKIDSIINQQAAGLNIYASLEKIDKGDPIRPGAFVEIKVEGKKIKDSFSVPEQAIYEESFIYILDGNKPKKLDIEIKGNTKDEIIVTGQLEDNDIIITTRLDNINQSNNLYSYK